MNKKILDNKLFIIIVSSLGAVILASIVIKLMEFFIDFIVDKSYHLSNMNMSFFIVVTISFLFEIIVGVIILNKIIRRKNENNG